MPFQLTLFRAPDGIGPMHAWDREHREPLGTRDAVRAALDAAIPGLRWESSNDMLFASGPFGGEGHAIEIILFGASEETLLDFRVYAGPPPVRAIMTALGLNHCQALESGAIYFPFEAEDRWPGAPP
ncbi:hypothetical protein H8N03_24620 [Ramlibacter sp. USB13]|uniref:Uncharacterized protein n=1 Tax=Ramlibacter cellulosilyticus TaxID=2764187 RepID=A0A923SDK9_9BURK|nr:hypothetical protein [Ramlibacter cellulosilyticus]MBC5786146.1 hypothetical protein [Ramlibacter cellulosilyticus]